MIISNNTHTFLFQHDNAHKPVNGSLRTWLTCTEIWLQPHQTPLGIKQSQKKALMCEPQIVEISSAFIFPIPSVRWLTVGACLWLGSAWNSGLNHRSRILLENIWFFEEPWLPRCIQVRTIWCLFCWLQELKSTQSAEWITVTFRL